MEKFEVKKQKCKGSGTMKGDQREMTAECNVDPGWGKIAIKDVTDTTQEI